jgi:hypothetical protein
LRRLRVKLRELQPRFHKLYAKTGRKPSAKQLKALINAVTGDVGTGTDLSGSPTYRAVALQRNWNYDDGGMNSYCVTSEMVGYDRRRTQRVLFYIAVFAGTQILFQVIWPTGMNMARHWGFITAVISGLAFGLLFEFRFSKRIFPYTIVVTDDLIRAIHPGFERSVRKNDVKTVAEHSNALFGSGITLRISKHGRLGTWFWGCVAVPKALPEYESIKQLVASWQTPL